MCICLGFEGSTFLSARPKTITMKDGVEWAAWNTLWWPEAASPGK